MKSALIALPEHLKRLNDRRVVAGQGSVSTPASENNLNRDVLELHANRIDLLASGSTDSTIFSWSANIDVENTSGRDLWIILTGLSVGACNYSECVARSPPTAGLECAELVLCHLGRAF